jgi:hypothetical protein
MEAHVRMGGRLHIVGMLGRLGCKVGSRVGSRVRSYDAPRILPARDLHGTPPSPEPRLVLRVGITVAAAK